MWFINFRKLCLHVKCRDGVTKAGNLKEVQQFILFELYTASEKIILIKVSRCFCSYSTNLKLLHNIILTNNIVDNNMNR